MGGGGKEHSVSRGRGMNRGQKRMSVGDHGGGGGGGRNIASQEGGA